MNNHKFRNLTTVLLMVFLIGTTGIASAGTTLIVPTETKQILIGGTIDFPIELTTTLVGSGVISWFSDNLEIQAKIDDVGSFSNAGTFAVITEENVMQTHTLNVKAINNAVVGKTYSITIAYCKSGICTMETVKALATATVEPVSELSTGILSAAGIIGLIGLVKFRKK